MFSSRYTYLTPGARFSGSRLMYHAVRGEIDAAVDAYADAIQERQPFAVLYPATRMFQPLREHPRWPALARLMNLA
jgi:hypothetical protein